ncbi:MAG: hypothetical protein ABL886_15130, partial [Rhodoglobus sp.]
MSNREAVYRNQVRLDLVSWFDARAIAMRRAMDAETGTMYADYEHGLTPAEHSALGEAFIIDPATISHAIIALADEEPIGHAALRPVSTGSTTGGATTGGSTTGGSTTGGATTG